MGNGDFGVKAQCLARLPRAYDQDDSAQSYCIFFFEVCVLPPLSPNSS
jgi:hypothetical protein